MQPQTLRNMTSDELESYVEQLDVVPRDTVLSLIAVFKSDMEELTEERDEVIDTLNRASAGIKDMVDNPLESAELYQKALKVWVEDWTE